MWLYVISFVVSLAYVYSQIPKAASVTSPSESDVDIPTAEEGKAVPVVFGTVAITDFNCVWYGDISIEPIKSSGGKK